MNYIGDEDLKKFLEGLIENDMNLEIEELKVFLKINGVVLLFVFLEWLVVFIEDIFFGVCINDVEIVVVVFIGLVVGFVICS